MMTRLLAAVALTVVTGFSAASADDAAPSAAAIAAAARPHHVYLIGTLRVSQAWLDVGSTKTADVPGYLIVENRGAAPDRLVGITLAGTSSVTIEGGDGAGGIEIPPNATVVLQPGAAHLDAHGWTGDTPKGAPVDGTLRFERSGALHLAFATDRSEAVEDDQSEPAQDPPVDLVQ